MMFSGLLSCAALAGVALCMPLAAEENLQSTIERRDNCTNFFSPGSGTVCIHRPYDCTANYTVQEGDSCNGIAASFKNFSLSIFHYWNPDIHDDCDNLREYVPYCINTPWYKFTPPVQQPVGTVEVAASLPATQKPFPIAPLVISNCAKFELAGPNVYVYDMVTKNGITYQQFYDWNQAVDPDQNNTEAGYWYCVGV